MGMFSASLQLVGLLALFCNAGRINSVRVDVDKALQLESETAGRASSTEVTALASDLAAIGSGVSVEVVVESAQGLHDLDTKPDGTGWSNGKADPFCRVTLKGQEPWDTKTMEDTILPIWNEKKVFEDYDCASAITFQVYDHDEETDELLGQATLESESFIQQPYASQLQLKFENGTAIPNSLVGVKVKLSTKDGTPPCSGGTTESGGTPEVGDRVTAPCLENDSDKCLAEVVKKESHGDGEGDTEVKVKFDDGQEEWYELGDVELAKSSKPQEENQDPENEDENGEDGEDEDSEDKPAAVANQESTPDNVENEEDEDDDLEQEETPSTKPPSCREWTEEMLPADWEKVASRRRKDGKPVFRNKKHHLRVASVKRACEYETGILDWHS